MFENGYTYDDVEKNISIFLQRKYWKN
jgi:hypothetical protein